jgi:hypothetical protein
LKQTKLIRAILAALLLAASCRTARALGEEEFGNAALSAANYKDWPGIMSVVNHSSRVYRIWVNGNEYFYYQGDMAALNEMLRKFTETKTAVREVVLRPGPGLRHSFDGTRQIPFGWNLHLIGGDARDLTNLELGDKVWSPHPVLSIYVNSDTDLSKLKIPKGLTLLSLSDLKQRTRAGLKSTDKTVRGWGSGELADLDPYDSESLAVLTGLLKDKDDWVRLNAVQAVSRFGSKAKSALPLLRDLQKTEDKSLKDQVRKSIQAIDQAEDRAAAERDHQATLEKIRRFLSQRKR